MDSVAKQYGKGEKLEKKTNKEGGVCNYYLQLLLKTKV